MPLTNALAQEIARVYGTPAVAIDLERVEANIARVQAACEAAGLANRPHIKTHKSPSSPACSAMPAPAASPARSSARRR